MENILKEKILEGQDAGTSPADETPQGLELNNSPVPTPEEVEEGGLGDKPEPEAEVSLEEQTQIEAEPEQEPAPEPVPEQGQEPTPGLAEGQATRSFSQDEVNDLIGKTRMETREKVTRNFFARYGVNSEEELDDLFGNAQRFDSLKEEYDEAKNGWNAADAERNQELADVKEKVALMESGIDKDRYEDAKLILRGKGLDITVDNINQELMTHPEWKKVEPQPLRNPSPFAKKPNPTPTKMSAIPPVLGNTGDGGALETEEAQAMKLFKL